MTQSALQKRNAKQDQPDYKDKPGAAQRHLLCALIAVQPCQTRTIWIPCQEIYSDFLSGLELGMMCLADCLPLDQEVRLSGFASILIDYIEVTIPDVRIFTDTEYF